MGRTAWGYRTVAEQASLYRRWKERRRSVPRFELLDRCEELERVVAAGIIAFQHTQEYVGEDVLPNIEGWSHYDWRRRAERVLGLD